MKTCNQTIQTGPRFGEACGREATRGKYCGYHSRKCYPCKDKFITYKRECPDALWDTRCSSRKRYTANKNILEDSLKCSVARAKHEICKMKNECERDQGHRWAMSKMADKYSDCKKFLRE